MKVRRPKMKRKENRGENNNQYIYFFGILLYIIPTFIFLLIINWFFSVFSNCIIFVRY